MSDKDFLQKIAPLFTTHGGREKSLRSIQFYCQFLIPTLEKMKY